MPLNENVVGKRYTTPPFKVSRRDALFFALACGEDNGAYFDEQRTGGIIAPPMYAAVYGHGPVAAIVRDKTVGLDFDVRIHFAQTYHWLVPVKPGDEIINQAVITGIETRENGGLVEFDVESVNQRGEIVVNASWSLFDKSAGASGAGRPLRTKRPPSKALWIARRPIPQYQTFVYAEASGDRNPIHLDEQKARRAGLPGIICHGLCTMALCHKAAVDHLCGPERNPLKLKTLSVQFSRPVLPGQTLVIEGFEIESPQKEERRFGLRVSTESGEVLRDAWCSVAAD
jgi:acyl dehydratase